MTLPVAIETINILQKSFGDFASCQGKRLTNEDYGFMIRVDPFIIHGVLDGHGGDECSKYFNGRIQEELIKVILIDSLCEKLSSLVVTENKTEFIHWMHVILDTIQQEWLEICKDDSGTTVLIAITLTSPGKVCIPLKTAIVNLGDSRCYAVEYNGTVQQITRDHSPTDPEEEEFIVSKGGGVFRGRVNGILMVSRAMGNKTLSSAGVLRHVPDVYFLDKNSFDYLVLCCDGITEKKNLTEFRSLNLSRGISKSRECIMEALESGSRDNLSCCMVYVNNVTEEHTRHVIFPGKWHPIFSHDWQSSYRSYMNPNIPTELAIDLQLLTCQATDTLAKVIEIDDIEAYLTIPRPQRLLHIRQILCARSKDELEDYYCGVDLEKWSDEWDIGEYQLHPNSDTNSEGKYTHYFTRKQSENIKML